jgi:BirA family transcriptional regulator, biotin operon repressor / biotin---[acetyl-CoA-carboxylase] ligase
MVNNDFMGDPLLDSARLTTILGARPFRFHPETVSTNDDAHQWAEEDAPAGAVVITEEQHGGRGRFNRKWLSPAGTALMFTVILRPKLPPDKLARPTMLGALAVAEALSGLPSLPVELISLKWPNDVHLGGRKVAGILTEALWMGDSLSAILLGIGVNVRVDFSDTELATKATSLEHVSGVPIDRAELLGRILKRIDHWSTRIVDRSLPLAWRGRLATIGQRVVARGEGTPIEGLVLDVEDEGMLVIKEDNGVLRRVVAGEVTLMD